MKRKILLFSAVALFAAGTIVVTTSCDDDNPISCTQKAIDVSEAAEAYTNDPSSENCIAYKNAIIDYLDCDITQSVDDQYQTILDGLDC